MRNPVAPEIRFARHYTVSPGTGCWRWHGAKTRNRYPLFAANGTCRSARQVAWELHHGASVHASVRFASACGDDACVNPDHLRIVEADNWTHRLTYHEVREIRQRHASGTPRDQLLADYNLSLQSLDQVLTGVTYRTAGGPILERNDGV